MNKSYMYWDCERNGFVSDKGEGDVARPKFTVQQMRSLIISAHKQGGTLVTGDDGNPTININAAESAKNRINLLKSYLAKTDYQAIKYAEGEMSEAEYSPIKVQRAEWRAEINELQAKFNIGGVV